MPVDNEAENASVLINKRQSPEGCNESIAGPQGHSIVSILQTSEATTEVYNHASNGGGAGLTAVGSTPAYLMAGLCYRTGHNIFEPEYNVRTKAVNVSRCTSMSSVKLSRLSMLRGSRVGKQNLRTEVTLTPGNNVTGNEAPFSSVPPGMPQASISSNCFLDSALQEYSGRILTKDEVRDTL